MKQRDFYVGGKYDSAMIRVNDKKNFAVKKWKALQRQGDGAQGADSDLLEDSFA